MKSRYYLTGVWVVIIGTFAFLMGWDPQVAIAVFGFGVILLVPLFVFVGVWNLRAVLKFWKSLRWWSFLPLGLLLISFWAIPLLGWWGLHLRVERFKKHLPEYEELVGVIRRNDITELRKRGIEIAVNDSDYMSLDLPDTLHHLGWGVRVRRGGSEGLTVIFVYAGGFGHHYADYVYREDGDFRKVLDKVQMHIQHAINKNWCAAGG